MAAAIAFPRFGDIAHLGHIELFTPTPDASLAFFTSIVGLHESGRSGDSVYLRGWGDYEWHTMKLTAHTTSGIGHVGLRVRDEDTLQRFSVDQGVAMPDDGWKEAIQVAVFEMTIFHDSSSSSAMLPGM